MLWVFFYILTVYKEVYSVLTSALNFEFHFHLSYNMSWRFSDLAWDRFALALIIFVSASLHILILWIIISLPCIYLDPFAEIAPKAVRNRLQCTFCHSLYQKDCPTRQSKLTGRGFCERSTDRMGKKVLPLTQFHDLAIFHIGNFQKHKLIKFTLSVNPCWNHFFHYCIAFVF